MGHIVLRKKKQIFLNAGVNIRRMSELVFLFHPRSDHMNPPTHTNSYQTQTHTHTHKVTTHTFSTSGCKVCVCVLRKVEVRKLHLREVRESILMGGSCRARGGLLCGLHYLAKAATSFINVY